MIDLLLSIMGGMLCVSAGMLAERARTDADYGLDPAPRARQAAIVALIALALLAIAQ